MQALLGDKTFKRWDLVGGLSLGHWVHALELWDPGPFLLSFASL
jgi:hypothetical protein